MDGFCCIFAIDYGKELFKGKLGKNPESAGRAVYCWFVILCEIADRVNISADRISLSLAPLGLLFPCWVWGHLNPSPWLSSGITRPTFPPLTWSQDPVGRTSHHHSSLLFSQTVDVWSWKKNPPVDVQKFHPWIMGCVFNPTILDPGKKTNSTPIHGERRERCACWLMPSASWPRRPGDGWLVGCTGL